MSNMGIYCGLASNGDGHSLLRGYFIAWQYLPPSSLGGSADGGSTDEQHQKCFIMT
jgi:hypothetical protein